MDTYFDYRRGIRADLSKDLVVDVEIVLEFRRDICNALEGFACGDSTHRPRITAPFTTCEGLAKPEVKRGRSNLSRRVGSNFVLASMESPPT